MQVTDKVNMLKNL